MVVNENNPKIWASLIAPNPEDVAYWVDLNADPHGNIIKFYDSNDEQWYNLTSPTSDYAVYPYIGPNGNWFIENRDSGISASGEIPNATINGYLLSTNPVLNKYDIGLGNVANLAPEDYPIPDGVYDLVDGKVDDTRTINGYPLTSDVTLTKTDLGLGSVENIATADMPISTAVNTALNSKVNTSRNLSAGYGLIGGGDLTVDRTFNVASANDGITVNPDNIQLNVVDSLASISTTQPLSANQGKVLNESKVPNTRTVNGYPLSADVTLTKTDVGLGNVSNLAPADLPVSTATQTALNSKVNTSRQVIAGTGLTGGGALTTDVTLNVASGNDGITASVDAITLNTVNNLTSTSVTQPLSAAQGKALQDGKINKDGTNSDINALHFNSTTLTALSNIGDVRFSDESKTLEVKVSDSVTLQLGQESVTRVKNDEASTISNSKVVYVSSALGANALAKFASTADADLAQRTFAMATEDIAVSGFGMVTTEGLVRGINTSGYTEGNLIWLSTNGNFTNVEPTAPTPKVCIGMVLRAHATEGIVYVKIRPIPRNSKLSDVYAPTLANGNVLRWNSTTNRFEVWDTITTLANKVDVVAGKGLSTNDYTTAEKNKLAGIAAGAEVNVNPDWNATSGDAQILNKPTTLAGYGITNAYTKTETDLMMTAVYKYKGVVATSANLPSTGMIVGDVWNVTDTNINYAWDGAAWDPLGGTVGADVGLATPTVDGLMSAADFVKLSGIATGAEVNVQSDWSAVSGDALILNKPTTISGYGITDAYTKTQVDTSLSGKEPVITAGTTAQYWRGDKSWQTLNKTAVGLSNVENTALSTWAGSTNVTTLGTITNGTWSGATIAVAKGGTGLTALGTANQLLRVNAGATALEYFTPTWTSNTGTVTSISMTVPTGLTVTGSPVTTAGTFALSFTAGYSIPTTAKQTNWDTAYGWGNHAGLYQPLDGDLTAIAGLSGTSGLLKKTAADTWTLDTSAYLTGNQTITLTGDVTGSGTTSIATTYNSTVPTTKGGTGLTTIGTAGQVLTVNAGATALEWTTPTGGGGFDYTGFTDTYFPIYSSASGKFIKSQLFYDIYGLYVPGETHLYQGNYFDPVSATKASVKISLEAGSSSNEAVFTAGLIGNAASGKHTYGAYFNNGSIVSGGGINYGIYVIGSTNVFTGTVSATSYTGAWNGTTIPTTKGGTGLTSIGTAGQVLRVNTGATGLEWGTVAGGLTLSGTQYGVVYAATSSTIASTAAGTAGQYLKSNGTSAPTWETFRDKGVNTVTTLASLPITKRLVTATVTAATTLSLASALEIGDELHVIVYNSSASAITQTLPNTGSYISLSGTSISIPAGGRVEINILCYATTSYIIRAL